MTLFFSRCHPLASSLILCIFFSSACGSEMKSQIDPMPTLKLMPASPPKNPSHPKSYAAAMKKFDSCCRKLTSHIITGAKATDMINKPDVVFIDVRKSYEQDVSMIINAKRHTTFDEKWDKSKTYIVYCTIGYRSGEFTKKMRDLGFTAFNLAGGIYGWTYFDGAVFDQQGRTKRVHVYSKSWNYLRPDYVAVD